MAVFYQVGDLGLAGHRGGEGTLGAGSWREILMLEDRQ